MGATKLGSEEWRLLLRQACEMCSKCALPYVTTHRQGKQVYINATVRRSFETMIYLATKGSKLKYV
jgi:hypothetical protein